LEGVRRAGDGKIELIIESTRTVTVKMEEEFIAKIDEFSKEMGYENRSEMIREAISHYLHYLGNSKRLRKR